MSQTDRCSQPTKSLLRKPYTVIVLITFLLGSWTWQSIGVANRPFLYPRHQTHRLTASHNVTVPADRTLYGITSPSRNLWFSLNVDQSGIAYSIATGTGPIVSLSKMALLAGTFHKRRDLTLDVHVVSVKQSRVDRQWHNAYGERSMVPDIYNELAIDLSSADIERFRLIIRVYDEGVAFRFALPVETPSSWQGTSSESVSFNIPANASAWFNDYAQGVYRRRSLSNWTKLCEPPLTVELADGQWLSILEAAQVETPHMRLALIADDQLMSRLAGDFNVSRAPSQMPWRVVMVAESAARLLEHNYLVLNLNPPSKLQDLAWVRPGRVMRSMRLETSFVKDLIDFATSFDIEYVELDAGWYGNEYDPSSDATRWNDTLIDLPGVIAYAKQRKRRVMLYVNHIELERHLDEVLDVLQGWGVDGIKFGYVNVGSQYWTTWLHDAIVKAAEKRLVVDVHDNYRSTGFHRTYPNLLQVEGIHGDEQFPNAHQSTIYPFTRFLTGPADHTYCFFHKKLKKTKAHQLALPVINFGPLQFIFWYDQPKQLVGEHLREVEFWRDLPTTWDDTRVLEGRPGELVTIARRKGEDWWIGAVTNETAQHASINLNFLRGVQGRFEATIYEDGPGNGITISRRDVYADMSLRLNFRPSGGAAVRIHKVHVR
jgi:alpha-glucosidase